MSEQAVIAEVNIHLRARATDKDLIDQAAALVGANRSQFMLASALKEARDVLLDQTEIQLSRAAFNKVMAWLDAAPDAEEVAGLRRLKDAKAPWQLG